MTGSREEREILQKWLFDDLGHDGTELMPFCMAGGSSRPLYLTHLPIALSAAGLTDLPVKSLEDLNAGYVYLTAAYYCMDAAVDNPVLSRGSSRFDFPAASVLLGSAFERLLRVFSDVRPNQIAWIGREFRNVLAINARALRAESNFCGDPNHAFSREAEFFHLWGRSNTFLFLFDITFALAGTAVSDVDRQVICETLYFLQLGDDLGDWREDYRAKKWTPFLRNCFKQFCGMPNEQELEEAVYLNGEFEVQMSSIISGLRCAARRLPGLNSYAPLKQFIETQALKGETALTSFVQEKLAIGLSYEVKNH